MSEDRLLDCRRTRRHADLTSASAHPELLCGYLAERPRLAASVGKQPLSPAWSRRMLAATVVAIAAVLLLPAFKHGPDSAARAQVPAQPGAACAPWETAAGDAVARLMQPGSMNLAPVSDAVGRLRRAGRSCELGWIDLACRDHQTIVAAAPQAPGTAHASWACPPAERS